MKSWRRAKDLAFLFLLIRDTWIHITQGEKSLKLCKHIYFKQFLSTQLFIYSLHGAEYYLKS